MKRFFWWWRDSEGLERAKRAEAEAEAHLRQSKATARWAEHALQRDVVTPDALTNQLIKILGGHQ